MSIVFLLIVQNFFFSLFILILEHTNNACDKYKHNFNFFNLIFNFLPCRAKYFTHHIGGYPVPFLNVTFESQDQADAAMAALRRVGIPFSASFQNAEVNSLPGGYIAHIVYPNMAAFSAISAQPTPGYLIATNAISASAHLARETRVSVRINRANLDRASALLRNNGAYSITQ
jgi:hypothetical protein